MGMTIDEARTALRKERKYALHENKQAFDMAIDTMRKYQKIQAIIANRESDENENAPQSKHIYMADAYMQIREVLKDGNDNR